ncbi:hypothetical protein MAHJHV33_48240 [Mycobacterium avium subsp. hominissuis]
MALDDRRRAQVLPAQQRPGVQQQRRPVVADGPALVVATPGAEPRARGDYGAAWLLDTWALLGRQDLRAAAVIQRHNASSAARRSCRPSSAQVSNSNAAP